MQRTGGGVFNLLRRQFDVLLDGLEDARVVGRIFCRVLHGRLPLDGTFRHAANLHDVFAHRQSLRRQTEYRNLIENLCIRLAVSHLATG